MGFMDQFKQKSAASKAYKVHVSATQLRKRKEYAASEEKFAEARKLYDEAYAQGALSGNTLMGYAILLMRSGEFEHARDMFLECFKGNALSQEDRYSVRIDYSICLWKLGLLDKAIESIERAAAVKKGSTIYTTLGMYLVDQARETGDFTRVIAFNEEALNYDDEDGGVLDNIGQMYIAMAELGGEKAALFREKAFEYEKRAFEVKPDQITSTYLYAKMLHERGENAHARDALKEIEGVPVTAVSQISSAQIEALRKEIG